MKHTKAPWLMNTTKRFMDNKGLAITDSDSILICEVSHDLGQLSLKEYEANAKLIVAAPEMLEAMQEFVDRCDKREVRSVRTYAKFKEIIKKATE